MRTMALSLSVTDTVPELETVLDTRQETFLNEKRNESINQSVSKSRHPYLRFLKTPSLMV